MPDLVLGKGDCGIVRLDLPEFLETRALFQANSGGGKSYALRKLLEVTHGRVQQIVVDVEDEFHTLRARYDYILAGGAQGDVPAHPGVAKQLARLLLDTGASAIVQINELKRADREAFVRIFLQALVATTRRYWSTHRLLVLDEAQAFAPEAGAGKAACLEAVIDVCSRGRKRGLCPVLATQRVSKLSKHCAAELNNKFIGRTGLDLDVRRAADDLGFERRDQRQLKTMAPGEFFAYGPAVSVEVVRFRFGKVKTEHGRANVSLTPPPPSRAVQGQVEQFKVLAELPPEQSDDPDVLKAELRKVQGELRRAQSNGHVDKDALEAARKDGYAAGHNEAVRACASDIESARRTRELALRHAKNAADSAEGMAMALRELTGVLAEPVTAEAPKPVPSPQRRATTPYRHQSSVPARRAESRRTPSDTSTDIGPERRLLAALAQHAPAKFTRAQVGALSGLKHTGGTFGTYLSRLRTAGYVEEDRGAGLLWASEAGIDAAGELPPAPRTPDERIAMWRRAVGAARKLLDPLVDAYPRGLTKDELAEAAGITLSGGTFGTYLSKLRSNALLDESGGDIKAAAVLFEGGQ